MKIYLSFRSKDGSIYSKHYINSIEKYFFDDNRHYFLVENTEDGEFINGLPYIENNKYVLNLESVQLEDVTDKENKKNLKSIKDSVVELVKDLKNTVLDEGFVILLNGFNLSAFNVDSVIGIINGKEILEKEEYSITSMNNVVSIEKISKESLSDVKTKLASIKEVINKQSGSLISKIKQLKTEKEVCEVEVLEDMFDSEDVISGVITLEINDEDIVFMNLKNDEIITEEEEINNLLNL